MTTISVQEEKKILPCLHCGSEETFLIMLYGIAPYYVVDCYECGMKGPVSPSQEGAVDKWNSLHPENDKERSTSRPGIGV